MGSDVVPLARGGIELISTSAVITLLATIWIGLRFYARSIKGIGRQPEDYMACVALIMLYVATGFICAMTLLGGIGHYENELQQKNITKMFQLSYGMQFSYAIGISLVKCSLCLTIVRVFAIQPYRTAACVAAGLSVAWAIAYSLVGLLVCKPISMFWDPTTPGGHCANLNAAYAATGFLDVSVDIFILIIPLPMVMKLQMPIANRIAVTCLFTLGIFTIIVGSLRTVAIVKLSFADASYSGVVPDLLTVLELGVAIIVASSAVMRPVFDKVFHSIWRPASSHRQRPSTEYIHYGSYKVHPSSSENGQSAHADRLDADSQDDLRGKRSQNHRTMAVDHNASDEEQINLGLDDSLRTQSSTSVHAL